jgi:hypothetical protein
MYFRIINIQTYTPIPITIALQPSPSVMRHDDNKKQSFLLDLRRSLDIKSNNQEKILLHMIKRNGIEQTDHSKNDHDN